MDIFNVLKLQAVNEHMNHSFHDEHIIYYMTNVRIGVCVCVPVCVCVDPQLSV